MGPIYVRKRIFIVEATYGTFYAAAYLPVACFLTFLSLWLRDKGLNEQQIGLLMAAGAVPRLIVNPLAGHMADLFSDAKAVLRFTAAMALVSSLVFLIADSPTSAAASFLILTCFSVTIVPLGDALTINRMRKRGLDYGRVRRWGSISIIVMAIFCGLLVEFLSISVFPLLLCISFAAVLGAVVLLPRTAGSEKMKARRVGLKRTLWGKFAILVFSGGLVQATHAPFNTYATLYWLDNGINPLLISVLWAIGISSEIIVFTTLHRLSKTLSPSGMILLGACVAAIRWSWLVLDGSLPTAIGVQVLQGHSLAATQTGVARYIADNFDQSVSATITSSYAMVSMGAIQSLLLLACSFLYSSASGNQFVLTACAAVAGAAICTYHIRSTNPRHPDHQT